MESHSTCTTTVGSPCKQTVRLPSNRAPIVKNERTCRFYLSFTHQNRPLKKINETEIEMPNKNEEGITPVRRQEIPRHSWLTVRTWHISFETDNYSFFQCRRKHQTMKKRIKIASWGIKIYILARKA
jgi:hypothetical protein